MGSSEGNAAVRDQVRLAAGLEWSNFEERHPALAGVLDREMVIEAATARLAEDADFIKAIAQAEAAGASLMALEDLVRGEVRGWLERLVG